MERDSRKRTPISIDNWLGIGIFAAVKRQVEPLFSPTTGKQGEAEISESVLLRNWSIIFCAMGEERVESILVWASEIPICPHATCRCLSYGN